MTDKTKLSKLTDSAKLQNGAIAVVVTAAMFTPVYGVVPVVLFITATVMFGAVCYLLAE